MQCYSSWLIVWKEKQGNSVHHFGPNNKCWWICIWKLASWWLKQVLVFSRFLVWAFVAAPSGSGCTAFELIIQQLWSLKLNKKTLIYGTRNCIALCIGKLMYFLFKEKQKAYSVFQNALTQITVLVLQFEYCWKYVDAFSCAITYLTDKPCSEIVVM